MSSLQYWTKTCNPEPKTSFDNFDEGLISVDLTHDVSGSEFFCTLPLSPSLALHVSVKRFFLFGSFSPASQSSQLRSAAWACRERLLISPLSERLCLFSAVFNWNVKQIFMFVSIQVSAEDWQPLPHGQCKACQGGRSVSRTKRPAAVQPAGTAVAIYESVALLQYNDTTVKKVHCPEDGECPWFFLYVWDCAFTWKRWVADEIECLHGCTAVYTGCRNEAVIWDKIITRESPHTDRIKITPV